MTITALVAALVLAVGCGKAKDEKLIEVIGKVYYQGKPLEIGAVIFVPDAAKGNTTLHEPHGSIDRDGHYEMMTAGKPGAPAGWYKVAVTANKPQDEKNPYAMPVSLLPKQYGEADKSNLAIEVVETPSPGSYDLNLK